MLDNCLDEKRSLSDEETKFSIDGLIKSRSAMDKLKTIRPFSESDLLNLHENSFLLENNDFIDKFIEVFMKYSIFCNFISNQSLNFCSLEHFTCKPKIDFLSTFN